ncbi:MAG: hypothetical protein R3B48_21545 [Kofleriaceae bacterium]
MRAQLLSLALVCLAAGTAAADRRHDAPHVFVDLSEGSYASRPREALTLVGDAAPTGASTVDGPPGRVQPADLWPSTGRCARAPVVDTARRERVARPSSSPRSIVARAGALVRVD